jgi:DNA-binding beta-propeller fold protein YncE
LTQKRGLAGCVAGEFSSARGCRPKPLLEIGLEGPALTVSADGTNVYVGISLLTFDRRADGEILNGGDSGGTAVRGEVISVMVSADGKNVYAATGFDGLAIFDRDPNDGGLTLKPGARGCFAGPRKARCMRATALAAPTGVSQSPDGRDVYVASGVNQGNALAIFDRDPATGALTQKPRPVGCVSQSGTRGRCAKGRGFREFNPLVNPTLKVTVSPDGRSVYLAGDTVAVFDRR